MDDFLDKLNGGRAADGDFLSMLNGETGQDTGSAAGRFVPERFEADRRERGLGEMFNLKSQMETGVDVDAAYNPDAEEGTAADFAGKTASALYSVAPFAAKVGRWVDKDAQHLFEEVAKTGEVGFRDMANSYNPFKGNGVLKDEIDSWNATEGRKFDIYERLNNGEKVDPFGVLLREMGKDGRYHTVYGDDGKPVLDPKYAGGEEAKSEARKAHMREFATGMLHESAVMKSRAAKERAADTSPWYRQLGQFGAEQWGLTGEFMIGSEAMLGYAGSGALGTSMQTLAAGLMAGKKGAELGSLGTRALYALGEIAAPSVTSALERYEGLRAGDVGFDENGEFFIADNGDGAMSAAAKATVGALAENVVESQLGNVVSKGLSRAFGGIAHRIPGFTGFFKSGVGAKAKDMMLGVVRNYERAAKMTKFDNPAGEFAEEYVQGILDDVVGLDRKASDRDTSTAEFTREFFDWDANFKELTLGILGMSLMQAGGAHFKERGTRLVRSVDQRVIGALKARGMTTGEIAAMSPSHRIAMAAQADPSAVRDLGYSLDDLCRFAGVKDADIEKMDVGDKAKVFTALDAVLNDRDGAEGVLKSLDKGMRGYINALDQRAMLDGSWKSVAKANERTSRVQWANVIDGNGNIQFFKDDDGNDCITASGVGAKIYRNADGTFRAEHPEVGYTSTFGSIEAAADWLSAIDKAVQERTEIREHKRQYVASVAERIAPTREKNGKTYGANIVTFDTLADALDPKAGLSESDRRVIADAIASGGAGNSGITLSDGTVAVFIDNCHSVGDALFTVLHELEHAGLGNAARDGEGLSRIIRSAWRGNATKNRTAYAEERRIRNGQGGANAADIAREEGLVTGHERRQAVASPMRRAIAALKTRLMDLGIDIGLTDADYAAIVRSGVRSIERTDRNGSFSSGVAFVSPFEVDIEVEPTEEGRRLGKAANDSKWVSEYYAQREALERAKAERDAADAARMHEDERRREADRDRRRAEDEAEAERRRAEDEATAADEPIATPTDRGSVAELMDTFFPTRKDNAELAAKLTNGEADNIISACEAVLEGTGDVSAVEREIAIAEERIAEDAATEDEYIPKGMFDDEAPEDESAEQRAERRRRLDAAKRKRAEGRARDREGFQNALANLVRARANGGSKGVKVSQADADFERAANRYFTRRQGAPWKFEINGEKYNIDGIFKRAASRTHAHFYGVAFAMVDRLGITDRTDVKRKVAERLAQVFEQGFLGHRYAVTSERHIALGKKGMAKQRKNNPRARAYANAKTAAERYADRNESSLINGWLLNGWKFNPPAEGDVPDFIESWRSRGYAKRNPLYVQWLSGNSGKTGNNEADFSDDYGRFGGDAENALDPTQVMGIIEEMEAEFNTALEEFRRERGGETVESEAQREERERYEELEAVENEANAISDTEAAAALEAFENERYSTDGKYVIMSDGTEYEIEILENGDIVATDTGNGDVLIIDNNGEGYEEEPFDEGRTEEEGDSRGTAVEDRAVTGGDAAGTAGADGADGAAAEAPRNPADAQDLTLESASADELKDEERRVRERREMERRQSAPLKGGTGEVGQTLMDLGGAEGEDLFNRTQRSETETTAPAAEGKSEAPTVEEAKAAAKVLGMDAFVPDAELKRKLAAWERGANNGPQWKAKIDAAKVILADRAAKGKDEAKREAPKVERDAAETKPTVVPKPKKAEKRTADKGGDRFVPKTSGKVTASTDEGFAAWAVGRDGKPMEFASEAERRQSREVFDMLVKRGVVNGETGASMLRFRRAAVTAAEDVAYMDAVKRGDTETAQRMVREAAAKAMPDTKVVGEDGLPLSTYRGREGRKTILDTMEDGIHFTTDRSYADQYGNNSDYNREGADRNTISAFLNLKNPLDLRDVIDNATSISDFKRRLLEKGVDLSAEYISPFSKKKETIESVIDSHSLENLIEDPNGSLTDFLGGSLKKQGFDGIITYEFEDRANPDYIVFNSNSIKSADPVTYDDAGNVIPLSERFNADNADIRWRRSYTPNARAQRLADALGITAQDATALNDMANLGDAGFLRMEKAARDMRALGTVSPEVQRIMGGSVAGRIFSRKAWDVVRRKLQDSLIDELRLEQRLGTSKRDSVYYALDRAYGLKEQAMSDFERDEVDALAKELRDKGIDGEENYANFKMYLLALHGAERNRMIAERSRLIAAALNDRNARPLVDAVLNGSAALDDKTLDDIARLCGWTKDERDEAANALRGSGLSTAAWNERLADFRASGFAQRAQGAVDIVRRITQKTRDLLVKSGRLSAAQAQLWERLSPNYVPMRSDTEIDSSLWMRYFLGGDEKRVGGKKYGEGEFRHAHGRNSIADDPVAFAIQQYEQAVQNSYDNMARQKLAAMVRANPKLGNIFQYLSQAQRDDLARRIAVLNNIAGTRPLTTAELDALHAMRTRLDEANNADRSVPTTKVTGPNGIDYEIPDLAALEGGAGKRTAIVAFKEGGDLKFIRLGGFTQSQVDADPSLLADNDALDIATAVKGQNIVHHAMFDALRKATGLFSALRTAYAPSFVASNFAADNTQALRNLYATFGADGARKFEHFAFGSFAAAKHVLNGTYGNSATDAYAKEWAQGGGRIGGMATENFSDIQRRFAYKVRMLGSQAGQIASIASVGDLARYLNDKRHRLGEFVNYYNSIVEMSTRIAAYATCREMGYSVEDAVSYSRDVTVNFNRKGEWTPVINALYAFSNASIQDFQRSIQAFADGRTARGVGILAGRGAKMAIGLQFLGFLASMLGFWQDDPEDEREGKPQYKNTREYIKQNSIAFRVGGYTLSVPIRGLSRIPFYMGHLVYETMTGNRRPSSAAADLCKLAMENVVDFIGNSASVAQTLTPSVFRPGMEIVENLTFSGSQMYRNAMANTDVRSEMGRSSTSSVSKLVARWLNRLTGGDAGKRGLVDVQPEIISAIWNWIGGSAARDITQASQTLADIATFSAPEKRNIPFLNRVVKELNENSADFYNARDRYKGIISHHETMLERGDRDAALEDEREHPYLAQDRRWGAELKDLNAIVTRLLKAEQHEEDGDRRRQIHELRLKSQYLFIHRLDNPPREDAEGVSFERRHNSLVRKFVDAEKRREKREKAERSRR